jgi:hypothetical protein
VLHTCIMSWQLDAWERGWSGSDKYICPACVDEEFLESLVQDGVDEGEECSFCGATGATMFDTFMEAFMIGVKNSFELADENMPYDGGPVFPELIRDAYDIADEFADVPGGQFADQVFEEIRDRLDPDKQYMPRYWIELEPEKAYSSAWNDFCENIKHRTRFVFWATSLEGDDYVGAGEFPVAKILDAISSLLERLGLIRTIEPGMFFYRARGHQQPDDSRNWRAADLGTNTAENSIGSSRMSPAGIPLFYGSGDVETALAEVGHADLREFFTVGRFATTIPIKVVDLTEIPGVPSIFDPKMGQWQGQIIFLHHLVSQLRQPVDPGRASLDYIPTQVFCEYFLRVFEAGSVRGIVWKSVTSPGEGLCVALDIPHDDCVDASEDGLDRVRLVLAPDSKEIHRRRTDEFRKL